MNAAAARAPGERPRRTRVLVLAGGLVASVVALYVLLPRIVGLDETWGRMRDGDVKWIGLAAALELASYSGDRTRTQA